MGSGAFLRNLKTPIEFNSFLIDDEERFTKTARTLARRIHRFGCVPVKRGAGLAHWAQQAVRSCEAFFSLPEETKAQCRAGVAGAAGYNPYASEGDRETFVVNRVRPSIRKEDSFFSKSANWPSEPERFQYNVECFYGAIDELTQELLQALSIGCGVEPWFFKSMIRKGALSTRMFCYSGDGAEADDIALPPHKDLGFLTLTPEAGAAGLEVWDEVEEEYLPVRMAPDEVLVLGGEALECVTAGHLRAPVHRLRMPQERSISIVSYLIGSGRAKLREMFPDAVNPYAKLQPGFDAMTPVEFVRERLGPQHRQGESVFSRRM